MTDTSNEVLNAALNYAERGWPVLPLWPGKKTPLGTLVQNGHLDATTDEATIEQWWNRYPSANIGIRVGPESGLFVLDVDNKNGKDGSARLRELENRFGPLPVTLTVQTPTGGFHYYFRFPNGLKDKPVKKELARGIDVKVNGFVVAAPSVIRDDCYAFVTEEP